jgi:heme a synthase
MPSAVSAPLLHRDRRAVSAWLIACALLVVAMVVVGGYTRLSGSGLSITQWKPIHGIIPPIGEAQWQEEFDAYRASPQYQKINQGMTLAEFKIIFWPEYFHRLLGRMVGLVFFLPLLFFMARRSLTRRLSFRLIGIFALGGLQGVIGWLMVKSGLVNDPHVSHLRLALHLSLAFAIFGLLLWTILDIGTDKDPSPQPVPITYLLWFLLLCLQIILGAFVAGLHAGLIYNTFPTMNGEWLPGGLLSMQPWYLNFVENITLIQFMHRTLAVIVAGGFLLWWYSHRTYVKNAHLGKVCLGVALVIAVQFTLGVLTLLHQVPLSLALLHQAVALLLFALAVALLHGLAVTGNK